jgi:hypothetical protein
MGEEAGSMRLVTRFRNLAAVVLCLGVVGLAAGCGSKYIDAGTLATKLGLERSAVQKNLYTGRVTISGRGHRLEATPASEYITLDGRATKLSERVRMNGVQAEFPSEVVKIARPTFDSAPSY